MGVYFSELVNMSWNVKDKNFKIKVAQRAKDIRLQRGLGKAARFYPFLKA